MFDKNKNSVLYAVGRPESEGVLTCRCRSVILIHPIFSVVGMLIIDTTSLPEDLVARPCHSFTEEMSSVVCWTLNTPKYIVVPLSPEIEPL